MTHARLERRLGLTDAVFIGLGSMIGAGVFVVFGPAAQAAGSALLVGLLVAAVVAFANATSSAQLAAAHPTSGGTYAYGRAEIGAWWGFAAGWAFVIGKTASIAAMAFTVAAYTAPPEWQRPVAAGVVVALTAITLLGVTRTATATKIIVVVSVTSLAVAVLAATTAAEGGGIALDRIADAGLYGILQSAGLLFFAFAGYARIATMGEEVRDPSRTIPRAIVLAFACALVVYAAVAVAVLATLGPAATADSVAPVADAVAASGWVWAEPIVRVGAVAAASGALLALIAGVARTSFAMARERDLPGFLAAVHPRTRVPHRAEIAVCLVVVAIIGFGDVRDAIGFSSFGVLVYYLVANLAALRQRAGARRYPRALQVLGIAGCLVLVLTLPWQSVAIGIAVLAVGLLVRGARLALTRAV